MTNNSIVNILDSVDVNLSGTNIINPSNVPNAVTINAGSMNSSSGYITMGASSTVGAYSIYSTQSSAINISQTGIKMDEDTDIVIGNASLKQFMEQVSERLAILQPNVELEKEWVELKRLGDQYRKLESELLEKANVWNILKKD